MIHHNKKQVGFSYFLKKSVSLVYHYGQLAYQAVRSCFGAGYWRGDKPWIGDEAWKG